MKALSFRQPWAELVLQGRKTLDLRTYGTDYRGPLAIHASQTVEKDRCQEFDMDPEALPAGAVVGIVQLVDVQSLSETDYDTRREEHLAGRRYRETLHGWLLTNPQRLPEPLPARGRAKLFNVDIDKPDTDPQEPPTPVKAPSKKSLIYDEVSSDVPFTLEVQPEDQHNYTLTLKQRVIIQDDDPSPKTPHYGAAPARLSIIVTLGGPNLRAVAGQVLTALREAGYKPTDLSPRRKKPFHLPEPMGVRLGLLFLAVKPLSKMTRVEAIAHGICRMPHEEAYYWYSKCTSAGTAERAQKAIRILLAAE